MVKVKKEKEFNPVTEKEKIKNAIRIKTEIVQELKQEIEKLKKQLKGE